MENKFNVIIPLDAQKIITDQFFFSVYHFISGSNITQSYKVFFSWPNKSTLFINREFYLRSTKLTVFCISFCSYKSYDANFQENLFLNLE